MLLHSPPDSPLNCSVAVRRPVDTVPYRSPQAVHTALAHHFLGSDVVEIGSMLAAAGLKPHPKHAWDAKHLGLKPEWRQMLWEGCSDTLHAC